jgi:hypothetical protein
VLINCEIENLPSVGGDVFRIVDTIKDDIVDTVSFNVEA